MMFQKRTGVGMENSEFIEKINITMVQQGSISHLLLQAENIEHSKEFYTDIVGFSIDEQTSFHDGRPLIIFEERMGLTELPDSRAETGQAVEHIAFQVPNIESLCSSLQRHDVKIDEGPKSTSYGTSIYFYDPDGNRIECHD